MLPFPLLQLPPPAPLWEPQPLVPSLARSTLSDMRFISLVPRATTSPAPPCVFARTMAPGAASAQFVKVKYDFMFIFNRHHSHANQYKPQVVVIDIIRWWQITYLDITLPHDQIIKCIPYPCPCLSTCLLVLLFFAAFICLLISWCYLLVQTNYWMDSCRGRSPEDFSCI